MKLSEIIEAFEADQLASCKQSNGPDSLGACWPELVECDYSRKQQLAKALIAAGLDCDLRNDEGLTPVEHALALNDVEMVEAMLSAEAELFDRQRMVYRLVRRGCVRLLEMFFEVQGIDELDKYVVLSYALEEVAVKSVPIRQDMGMYCHRTLLSVFYGGVDGVELSVDQRRDCIRQRLEVMVKEIEFLATYGTDSFSNIDNEFMLALKIVSESSFVVDQLWTNCELGPRSLWSRLRPRKLIFCLETFLAILQGRALYKVYALFIDKQLILMVLTMFGTEIRRILKEDHSRATELESYLEKLVRQNDIRCKWEVKFPNQKLTKKHEQLAKKHNFEDLGKTGLSKKHQKYLRMLLSKEQNVHQLQIRWSKKFPSHRLSEESIHRAIAKVRGKSRNIPLFREFSSKTRLVLKHLDRLYTRMKSFHSVNRIMVHIKAVKDIPLTEEIARTFAYAAFRRAVQVFGECCKNTRETPSLGSRLHLEMSRHHSRLVMSIFENERNSSTHELSLADVCLLVRKENGEMDSTLLEYCTTVQAALRESYRSVEFLRMYELLRALRIFLGRILRLSSVEQCNSLSQMTKDRIDIDVDLSCVHDFEKMFNILDSLLTDDECAHLREELMIIRRTVETAQESMMNHNEELAQFKDCLLNFVATMRVLKDLTVIKRIAKYYLQEPVTYHYGDTIELLGQADELLQSMNHSTFSEETSRKFLSLNFLFRFRPEHAPDIRKIHYTGQLIPSRNELYTDYLLRSLAFTTLDINQFNTIHETLARKVYNPLHRKYKAGMFMIDQKFQILEQLLKEKHISYDKKLLQTVREQDRHNHQQLLERMLHSLHKLSEDSFSLQDEYQFARMLATHYGLLEVCSTLSHTAPFQKCLGLVNSPTSLLTGRSLRNAISHDVTFSGTMFFSFGETVRLTVQVLHENRSKLLNCRTTSGRRLPTFGNCLEMYERRKRFAREQKIPLDGNINNLLTSVDTCFDICGCHFGVWESGLISHHNLLDIALYNYPDDAIAYIETAVQHDYQQSKDSVLEYLWGRLRHSELLGGPLQPMFKVYSINGDNYAFSDEVANIEQLGFEDLGFLPKEQVEKILSFCLLVRWLDKFKYFYTKYGKQFDFVKSPHFYHMVSDPTVVDKLSELFPWSVTDERGLNFMHLFAEYNNVQALQAALKLPQAQLFCRARVDNWTPLKIALTYGCFEAARELLTWSESMELQCLYMIIVTWQNDLLKHYIPELNQNQFDEQIEEIIRCIGCSGNIEAFKYFKSELSTSAFGRLMSQSKVGLLGRAIQCNTKLNIVEQFLAYPEVYENINCNESMSLSLDSANGRFKYAEVLKSNGAKVTFRVVLAAVQSNSYTQTRKLYKMLQDAPTAEQLLKVINLTTEEGLDVRFLPFFITKLPSVQVLPCKLIDTAILYHNFEHCRYLCQAFPNKLEELQSNQNEENHPLLRLINRIYDSSSLAKDKPFLLDFIKHFSPAEIHHQPKPLLDALLLSDLDVVRALLDRGAPINGEYEGFTPLALAAANCASYPYVHSTCEVFKLLLQRGADIRFLMISQPELMGHFRVLSMIIEHTDLAPDSPDLVALIICVACAPMSNLLTRFLLQKYSFLNVFRECTIEGPTTVLYDDFGPNQSPKSDTIRKLLSDELVLSNDVFIRLLRQNKDVACPLTIVDR